LIKIGPEGFEVSSTSEEGELYKKDLKKMKNYTKILQFNKED
jgi:hypothetical protein